MRRLPKAWPVTRSEPDGVLGKRYWRRRVMTGSASARAAMQLRMSPTGAMPSSLRRRPDDPPSSATATTAVMLLV